MARAETDARGKSAAAGRFEQWRPWLEMVSWLGLGLGLLGAVLRFAAALRLAYARAPELSLLAIWQSSQVMAAVGQVLLEMALVAFLFLVIRLLIAGVPGLLRGRDTD